MNMDDLKAEWAELDPRDDDAPAMADAEVLALVRGRADSFDRMVRARDRRELVAAVAVCALLLPALVAGAWLARLGAIVLVVACVVAVGAMRRARRETAAGRGDRPVAEALRAQLARVDAQVRLLRSVLWWYVAPFAVGALLVFAGSGGRSWLLAGYAVAVLALGVAIHALNQRAVRDELLPERRRIAAVLAQVTDDQD